MNSLFQYLAGMPVVVNELLFTEKQVQVKTHRKKRINKKWRKRYGFATVRTPTSYIIAGTLYVHPVIFHELKKQFAESGGDPEILMS